MKTCTKCNETKELTEFYPNHRNPDGYFYRCIACERIKRLELEAKGYYKAYYERPEVKKRRAIRARENSKAFKQWLSNIKVEVGCFHCNEGHEAVLDFHHEKPSDKAIAITRCRSKRVALTEINKCIVLCSNCHRKLHYELKKSL